MRKQERSEKVALLSFAGSDDTFVVGLPLGAVIVRAIVVVAVVVAFTIRLVVLVVVGNEIVQGEAVVGGEEIDPGPWTATPMVIDVAGPCETGSKIAGCVIGVLPVIPDRIAIFIIPLGPAGWKAAHLVSTWADVPRLTDKLDLGQCWVLTHRIEEAAALV